MRLTTTKCWLIIATCLTSFLLLAGFTVKPKQVTSGQLTLSWTQKNKGSQQTIRAKQDPFSYVFSTKSKYGKRTTTSCEYSDQHYWYHQDDQGKWVKVAKSTAFSPNGHLLDPDDFSQLLWSFDPQTSWQLHQKQMKKQGKDYVFSSKQKKLLKQGQSLISQLAPQAGKIKCLTYRWRLNKHQVQRLTYTVQCQHGQVKLTYSQLNQVKKIKIPTKVKQAPIQADNEGRG